MDNALRYAWTELISAVDLDDHMLQVGQAEANAALIQSMLASHGTQLQRTLLLVGGGTAQFLDYVPAVSIAHFDITFSDINPSFLKRASERFARAKLQNVKFVVDDIEASKLNCVFDVIVVVLVLEHIDWQCGLRSILRLTPNRLHIVIQENPAELTVAIAPQRRLNASMHAFAETAYPKLVPDKQLVEFLAALGYRLCARDDRPVPDGKTMVGLSFVRA